MKVPEHTYFEISAQCALYIIHELRVSSLFINQNM